MRIVSMLVVVLGIAAIENGSDKSLGNVAAASLANIPGVKNDTEIGAEASSAGFLIFLGCPSELSKCLEDEECNQCVNAQTDDDDDGGSEDDDNLSCDEQEKEWCDSRLWLEDTCFQNEEYAAWWECVVTTWTGCEIDATCSGAMTVVRFSGGIVLLSAVLVGLLSAGIGMA